MAQLDPSIILQAGKVQPLQASDVLEQRAQIQLRNLALQRQSQQDAIAARQDVQAQNDRRTLGDIGKTYATDPGAARKQAYGTGSTAAIDLISKLDGMDDAGRKRAFEVSQATAPLLLSLKTVDPEARVGALAQIAPELQARGFTPEHIQQLAADPSQLSNDGLDRIGSSAMTIAEYVRKQESDRNFGLEGDKFAYQKTNDAANRGVTIRGQDLSHSDSAAGRAVTMRGQDMSHADTGKAPSGYRWGANGALEAIPGGPGDKVSSGRPVPAAAAKAYVDNNTSLRKIDRAWTLLNENGDAVGGKGYTPNFILQRTDPKGVAARAAIADIGSLLIHDRSGAAVTVSETPRLLPFIPQVTDTPATIKAKLRNLRSALSETQDDMDSVYSPEQGYKGLPKYTPPVSKNTPVKITNDADYAKLAKGALFVGPDGHTRRKP